MSDDDYSKGHTDEPNSQFENQESANKRKTIDLSKGEIKIEVCNPVTREEKFGKHTVYTVRGSDKDGNFEAIRRYSDFDKLRPVLVARWPGVYVPPLPPKKTVNNMDTKFIEERKKSLDQFVKKISEIPHLHYSEEFQLFIRSNTPDLEKSLQVFQKVNYEELIAKYTTTFSHLSGKELTNETILKISGFKLFLTKVRGYFENFKKISKSVALAKKRYYEELANMHHMTCVPYEKNVFSEYHSNKPGRNIFFDEAGAPIHETGEKLKTVCTRESLEYINEWMETEAREIDAFLEAMNQREKYDTLKMKTQEKHKSETEDLHKVVAGKKTMKTLFSSKPKEEEIANLEKTIALSAKAHEELTSLYDMMTLILAYDEIDRFKRTEQIGYYRALGFGAESELNNLHDLNQYWNSILENQNVKNLDNE